MKLTLPAFVQSRKQYIPSFQGGNQELRPDFTGGAVARAPQSEDKINWCGLAFPRSVSFWLPLISYFNRNFSPLILFWSCVTVLIRVPVENAWYTKMEFLR